MHPLLQSWLTFFHLTATIDSFERVASYQEVVKPNFGHIYHRTEEPI